MAQLNLVASDIMDKYFQDFAPANAIFGIEVFMAMVVQEYSKLLQTDFERQKILNKAETGYSIVEISPDFLIEEEVETERDKEQGVWIAKLKNNVFSFNFDAMGNGVQYMEFGPGDARQYITKISYTDRWQAKRMPTTKQIFAYVKRGNVIEFINGNPDKVYVQYIPALDETKDDCYIADAYVPQLNSAILNVMFFSKNGLPIDVTNDQNKNAIQQTEINKESLKTN